MTKSRPVGEVLRSQQFSFKYLFIYGFTEKKNFGSAVFKNIAVMRYFKKREFISLPFQPAVGCQLQCQQVLGHRSPASQSHSGESQTPEGSTKQAVGYRMPQRLPFSHPPGETSSGCWVSLALPPLLPQGSKAWFLTAAG